MLENKTPPTATHHELNTHSMHTVGSNLKEGGRGAEESARGTRRNQTEFKRCGEEGRRCFKRALSQRSNPCWEHDIQWIITKQQLLNILMHLLCFSFFIKGAHVACFTWSVCMWLWLMLSRETEERACILSYDLDRLNLTFLCMSSLQYVSIKTNCDSCLQNKANCISRKADVDISVYNNPYFQTFYDN